jgi:3-oxoacyl-[acyl-carrier protein] reductase
MSTEKKIALVTGATRGIGKAIALRLAKAGNFVIGTATSDDGAKSITQYLTSAGFSGEGYTLNVSKTEEIAKLIDTIVEKHGAIHILVNNAGITRDGLSMRMKEEDWQAVIDTNLSSVFHVSKACIKHMMKSRFGRIINISSVVAFSGNPGQANYCAAKAGIIGLTKALAIETATRGITINSIAPGFIQTDMTEKLNDDQKNAILKNIPMQKMGTPDDIACAAAFIASDDAAYITGQTFHVNGGLFMS